jgi:hypothetical protein
MRRSAEVTDTLLRFYEVFSAPDLEGLAQKLPRRQTKACWSLAPTLVTGHKVENNG